MIKKLEFSAKQQEDLDNIDKAYQDKINEIINYLNVKENSEYQEEILKSCPFCGETPKKKYYEDIYFISCDVCQITFKGITIPEVIQKWNERKGEL